MQYTFGDSDLAAKRLGVVAEVFAATSSAFLLGAVSERPQLAVDLGCGPGYSTHLVAEAVGADRTVGLDKSEHFVALARRTETDRVSFRLHDVVTSPFPMGPADLIYCRFLLSHLTRPGEVIARWATQLRPQGRLLLEEVEWIRTDNPAFAEYLGIVELMLRQQSSELYVGPLLDGLGDTDGARCCSSQVSSLLVSNREAAAMFFLNIQSWRHQPFVRQSYDPDTIDRLQGDLRVLTQDPNSEPGIEWGLRQITLARE